MVYSIYIYMVWSIDFNSEKGLIRAVLGGPAVVENGVVGQGAMIQGLSDEGPLRPLE